MNVVVVGCGSGGSAGAKLALMELAMEQGYTIVVDDVKNVFEPEPEVFLITRNDILEMPEVFIEPDKVPFSKFRETKQKGKHLAKKRNFSHRRR